MCLLLFRFSWFTRIKRFQRVPRSSRTTWCTGNLCWSCSDGTLLGVKLLWWPICFSGTLWYPWANWTHRTGWWSWGHAEGWTERGRGKHGVSRTSRFGRERWTRRASRTKGHSRSKRIPSEFCNYLWMFRISLQTQSTTLSSISVGDKNWIESSFGICFLRGLWVRKETKDPMVRLVPEGL